MSGLLKSEAKESVVSFAFAYPAFDTQMIEHNVDWRKVRQIV